VIAITGGAGFMGRHLVERLRPDGRSVTVIDRVAPPGREQAGVRFVQADIGDAPRVAEALAGAEVVVHLAARVSDFGRARDFERANVDGTRTVAGAARAAGARRFVLMSSVAVFDYRRGFRDADETTAPGGHEFAYGRSKLRAEQVVRELEQPGFEIVILRPGVLPYGPGDRLASARLLAAIERGVPFLVGGGRALLSTSYIDNLIAGIVCCLDHPAAAGETFHLADDVRVTWRELLARMAAALGVPPPRGSSPRWLAASAAATLEAAWRVLGRDSPPPLTRYRVRTVTSDLHFSNQKAKHLLGWIPAVGLDQGLAATVAWYRAGMAV
jgi:nucleoside-diphosphate-sugar epimerase